MSEIYDVIVIGSGPAGYPAAIRAAQNKLKVACIDEWKNTDGSFAFGGTCLNAGCIPSKALLESSELFQRAKDEFGVHGIKIGDLKLDLAAMQKRRAAVVKTMTGGITALFKANGVIGLQGHGRLLPGNKVLVTGTNGAERTLEAKHVVLASGSVPVQLRNVPHDGKFIVDSWNALEFDAVPARLGVIGAVLATALRGLERDVYFQVAMLTTIGLASKNAILIVEFAKENVEGGMPLISATLRAVHDRLRPILMTSLAFGLGVLPLALATGAGAGAQRAIGTGVFGGMVAGTFLGIFFIPLFFVIVQRLFHSLPERPDPGPKQAQTNSTNA